MPFLQRLLNKENIKRKADFKDLQTFCDAKRRKTLTKNIFASEPCWLIADYITFENKVYYYYYYYYVKHLPPRVGLV